MKFLNLFLALFFALLTLILAIASQAQSPSETCLNQIADDVFWRSKDLGDNYIAQDTQSMGLHQGAWASFMRGDNDRAVLVVHGFAGSPFEVMPAAQALHEQGYSVLPLLIEGFGSSTKIANSRHYKDWQKSIAWGVQTLGKCYSHISIVGFSLGGGLTVDYVLNQNSGPQIDHVVLLSPYISAQVKKPVLTADLFELLTFSDDGNYKFLSLVGRLDGASKDLKIPMKYSPEDYTEAFPIHAAKEISRFSVRALIPELKSKQSAVPTLMVYSNYDHTINYRLAQQLLSTSFKNIHFISYAKDEKIVHQIDVKDSQNDLLALHQAIVDFLEQ
jgi:esterase/lipase